MNGWRSAWAAAQVTGVLFSTLVWIVVWGLSLPSLAVSLAVGIAAVTGRNTRLMLWWRFGAAPANDFHRQAVLSAIVPIASLRGRHQPSVWIGRRLYGSHIAMPSWGILVVSPMFLRQVVSGKLTDRQASAIVCQALGLEQVTDSALVNALDAYCLPWRFVQVVIGVTSQVSARHAILELSWKLRWVLLAMAAVDAYSDARWAALSGVILIAILSWSTGHCHEMWVRKLQDLGNQRAISEGLGQELADLNQGSWTSLSAKRAPPLRCGTSKAATANSRSSPLTPAGRSQPPRRAGCVGSTAGVGLGGDTALHFHGPPAPRPKRS